jgi:hypothetical protein
MRYLRVISRLKVYQNVRMCEKHYAIKMRLMMKLGQ